MKKWVFLAFLLWGAYKDLKAKELDGLYLLLFGLAGCVCSIITRLPDGDWMGIAGSCGIGVLLLGFSRLTDGGIGEGDGWFFINSGLFLTWEENLGLLCSGWFLCFVYCLMVVGARIGKKQLYRSTSVPFLPFLVPAGIYLACFVQ